MLFLSGLISGSEVAYFSLTSTDYDELEGKDTANGRLILKFRDQPRYLLATILIANNFINIAIVLISDVILGQLFPTGFFITRAEDLLVFAPVAGFPYTNGHGLRNSISDYRDRRHLFTGVVRRSGAKSLRSLQ